MEPGETPAAEGYGGPITSTDHEAQKDRFALKIVMDSPDQDSEVTLAQRMLGDDSPEATLDRGDVEQVASRFHQPQLEIFLTEHQTS